MSVIYCASACIVSFIALLKLIDTDASA